MPQNLKNLPYRESNQFRIFFSNFVALLDFNPPTFYPI